MLKISEETIIETCIFRRHRGHDRDTYQDTVDLHTDWTLPTCWTLTTASATVETLSHSTCSHHTRQARHTEVTQPQG